MNVLHQKAYAKINLGLDILSKREDGYHEVSMVMHSIDLYDDVIIEEKADGKRVYSTDSSSLPMDESNLVCKAAELFCKKYEISRGYSIYLKKRIPMAAGLAGGSSDAAAVLRGLNELFQVGATTNELMSLGKQIGADVPYCVLGKTALAEGIGEKLTEITQPPHYGYLIVKPNIDVSTKWAYNEIDTATDLVHPDINGLVKALEEKDDKNIASKMGNIFENVIKEKYPIIEQIKKTMIENGAYASLMSGSGPTVFGMFKEKAAMEKAAEAVNALEHECIYKIW